MTFKDLSEKVAICSDVSLLKEYKSQFVAFSNKVLAKKIQPNDPQLKDFLDLCLDYYVFSTDGDVLIPDRTYDACMEYYKSGGNNPIIYAHALNGKKWNLIKHKIPGVVGTLDKAYTYDEIKKYLHKHSIINKFIIAPKFDGISCAIEVVNGEIISAATRYDGIEGQDITELVKRAANSENFIFPDQLTGFYKCELCVGSDDFEIVKKLRGYANRRSATSAIINTPTNLSLAEYVTIIPLLVYHPENNHIEYVAPYQKIVDLYSPSDLMDTMEGYLEGIRSRKFPFRVDGVVLFPATDVGWQPNPEDLMDQSIAYKVNTAENKTEIEYGYMSIGRLGKAMPMLHVKPVEVNETIVTDVSLGSWEKFTSMGLFENEEVIVYSAGDVIPQVKLPEMRMVLDGSELLKIKRRCPHCGEKLEKINSEYFCTNDKCPRIITGKISNFLIKLGIEGFSDKTIESLYSGLGIKSIPEVLNLSIDTIKSVDGFEMTSALSLFTELQRIRKTPITVAKFFGALGIDKISEKKCRRIFEYTTLDEILKPKKWDDLYYKLQCSDGIGDKTAKVFLQYVKKNFDMIRELIDMLNLMEDIKYDGNVVFTGLRPSEETLKLLAKYNLEEGNSVTKNTVCVVAASTTKESTKMKSANKKGIPVIYLSDLENFLKENEEEARVRKETSSDDYLDLY